MRSYIGPHRHSPAHPSLIFAHSAADRQALEQRLSTGRGTREDRLVELEQKLKMNASDRIVELEQEVRTLEWEVHDWRTGDMEDG